jgi:hypothetical protein
MEPEHLEMTEPEEVDLQWHPQLLQILYNSGTVTSGPPELHDVHL